MKTLEILAQVDSRHRLSANVPDTVAPGPVKISVILPEHSEDAAGRAWADAIAREWAEELSDRREDIYNLDDGEPVDESR
jgi:hypothetical protein